jgi:hypothetical protein
MSKFFRALEQAERDNAQREPLVPAAPVSERAPIVPRWPEPANEQPPVFSAPPPRAPRPAVKPARPTVESPPAVELPRVASALLGGSSAQYPRDNFVVGSWEKVKFEDLSRGRLRLTDGSPYRRASLDGKDVGVDDGALQAAVGTASGRRR